MNDPRITFAAETVVDLAGATATVLGCGSLGGLAAWCLASAGVGSLKLADRDRLLGDNLRRHVCGAPEQGQPKPRTVARFLLDRYPHLRVRPQVFCFLQDPERLRSLIAESEIVLVAVDEEGPKHLIDAMTWELSLPAVYAGVYGGGWGAEAILVDPVRGTPCYACAARALGRAGIEVWPAEPQRGYALRFPATGQEAWAQADLCSIMPAAALATRLAIALLAAQRGHERSWQEFGGPNVSAWRLAVRQVPSWGIGPWHLEPVRMDRDPNCPLCGSALARSHPDRLQDLLDGGHP